MMRDASRAFFTLTKVCKIINFSSNKLNFVNNCFLCQIKNEFIIQE